MPLDAKFGRLVGIDLGDQAFDKHLGAAHVKLVDHRPQLPVLRLGRGDDEGVGGRVGLDLPAGGRLGRLAESLRRRVGGRDAANRRRGGRSRHPRLARQRGAQGHGQLDGFGVFQIDHINVAARAVGADAGRLVELVDQRLHQGHPRRIGGTQDQRVGARLSHQGGPERAVRALPGHHAAHAGRRFDQAQDQGRQIRGNGVFERDDLDVGCVGHIQRRDDAPQAAQVVSVVGDHQGVVAGVDVDGVVRADQGPQNRHQVVGRFVIQPEYLRDDLVAHGGAGGLAHGDRAALQLGVGFGHDFVQPGGIDHGEPLHAQRGQKLVVGRRRADRFFSGERHHALDARVHHHVAPGDGAHGARNSLDVGVDKIQRDGLAATRVGGLHGALQLGLKLGLRLAHRRRLELNPRLRRKLDRRLKRRDRLRQGQAGLDRRRLPHLAGRLARWLARRGHHDLRPGIGRKKADCPRQY